MRIIFKPPFDILPADNHDKQAYTTDKTTTGTMCTYSVLHFYKCQHKIYFCLSRCGEFRYDECKGHLHCDHKEVKNKEYVAGSLCAVCVDNLPRITRVRPGAPWFTTLG
jgi:hypothetical protein